MTRNEFRSHLAFLFLVALSVTIINSLKPFHIDDTYYFWVAQQILSQPFNPFGFEVFWQQWPMAAHESYVPPLMPYWLALSSWMFGDNPFLLKFSMFPFVLLFTVALYLLGKRILPSTALPFTVFLSISPAVLPSWNIMLDLPSIALGLIAIELFIRAIEKNTWQFAFAAGCLTAAAVLTKFSALAVPGVILLYGLLNRRVLTGLGTGVLVLTLIAAWEYVHFLAYGHTQLIWSVMQGSNSDGQLGNFSSLSISALMTLGALFPLLIGVYVPVNNIDRSFVAFVVVTAILTLGGYIFGIYMGNLELLFVIFGSALFAVIVLGTIRAIHSHVGKLNISSESGKMYIFLSGWLALEAAAYFLVSPFPAVRRLLVLSIVLTFLGFRILDCKITPSNLKAGLAGCWILVATNLVLTGLFEGVDFKEANAQKALVSQTAGKASETDNLGSIWYAGHWGFAYYAEKAGMEAVIPESSLLKAGDWLVLPDRVHSQQLAFENQQLTRVAVLEVSDNTPLHTVSSYYAGRKPLELKGAQSRLKVSIYRVNEDVRARTPWNLSQIIQYIRSRPKQQSTLKALPALLNFRGDARADIRKLVVETVATLNELAVGSAPIIADMTTDQNTAVRIAVLEALSRLGNREPVVLAAIAERTHDPDPHVRMAAQAALGRLGAAEPR